MIGATGVVPNLPIVDRNGHMSVEFRRIWLQIWEFSGVQDVANALRLIDPQALAASNATLFTASRAAVQVTKLTLTNTDSSNHAVTLYYVPKGQAAGASNSILSAYTVTAGTTYTVDNGAGHVLNKGDSIQGFADTGAVVSIVASGIQLLRVS